MESGEFAAQLAATCRRALQAVGHADCAYLGSARYVPESAAVVCGCGMFVAAPDPIEQAAPGDNESARRGGSAVYQATDPIKSTLDLIDPTEQYTPEQVEQHILDVLYRLETGAMFERECIENYERAVGAFNRVYWATIHVSEARSELSRKAEAEVECQDRGLTTARDEAKMLKSAAAATMHNLRAVLSGYQSVAKSVASAYSGGGSPGRF